MSGQPKKQKWEAQERGVPFMLRLMHALALKFGRNGVRWILYPTVAYFLLTTPRGVRASRLCLSRFLGRRATLRDVARHFFAFSSCTQDRIFLLSNQHQALAIDAYWSPDIPAVLARTPGCLLMVGHVGSREALRLTPPPPLPNAANLRDGKIFMRNAHLHGGKSLEVAVLLERQVERRMTAMFEKLNPTLAANIIDASERGPALVLKLKETLESGRMVGIGADRARAEERAIEATFMEGTVRFPEGPWILAAALGAPVILGFGLYRGGNRYDVHFELFSERITLSRQNRRADMQRAVQRYAARLEHYARLAPYNWFNFYDFWTQEPSSEPATDGG